MDGELEANRPRGRRAAKPFRRRRVGQRNEDAQSSGSLRPSHLAGRLRKRMRRKKRVKRRKWIKEDEEEAEAEAEEEDEEKEEMEE